MRGIAPDRVLDKPRKVGFNAPIFSFLDVDDPDVAAIAARRRARSSTTSRGAIEELHRRGRPAEQPEQVPVLLPERQDVPRGVRMTDRTRRQPSRARYLRTLEQFTTLCELVRTALPYLAVVLCHELYRFLYPVEPYANFVNDRDPVADAVRRGSANSSISAPSSQRVGHAFRASLSRWTERAWQTGRARDSRRRTCTPSSGRSSIDTRSLKKRSIFSEPRLPETSSHSISPGGRFSTWAAARAATRWRLARLGAARATGIDLQAKSFQAARRGPGEHGCPGRF